MKNIFIEGLMGAGKSTLLTQLSEALPEYKAYREGVISPVELAWCTYNTVEEYNFICNKFKEIEDEIKRWTVAEGDKRIIAYTKILTDIEGFHRFMEQYEIYSGKKSFQELKNIILTRYKNLNTSGNIFECSFFQNSLSEMIAFQNLSKDEIIEFYKEAFEILKHKDFKLIYLDTEDIESIITVAKNERLGENGEEWWFPLVVKYYEESSFGKETGLKGLQVVLEQLKIRREIELRVIKEVLGDKAIVLKSKSEEINISTLTKLITAD